MNRIILALRSGRDEKRAILSPGDTVAVGRAERCDLVVAGDEQLSAVHFALTWTGTRALLTDRESRFGTEVDGRRAKGPTACHPGSFVRAGQSVFTLHGEDATKASGRSTLDPSAAAALAELRRARGTLYAIVDASRGRRVTTLLQESVDRHASLYDGLPGRKLELAAPFLVEIAPDSMLIERLLAEGWRRRWCSFLTSRAAFVDLRRHLRRFLMVEDETRGVRVYFRYYDPAILRLFLRNANRRQREAMFAAVERFYVEDDDGSLAVLALDGATK